MTKKVLVISPECCKESAEHLATLLGAKFSLADKYDYTEHNAVINYGSSNVGEFNYVINHPDSVKLCVNKLSTFKRIPGCVTYTKDPQIALEWLKEDGAVVARATETGSKSSGVTICLNKEAFKQSPAKFWTRFFKYEHEVRVNVYKGKILSVYEKVEEDGLFTFNHMPITGEHKQVSSMIEAIRDNLGIDYYGMDILVNKDGVVKLLEVNSGPTLMEETEEALVSILKKELANV